MKKKASVRETKGVKIEAIKKFITEFDAINKYKPSKSEIAAHFGCSRQNIDQHFDNNQAYFEKMPEYKKYFVERSRS